MSNKTYSCPGTKTCCYPTREKIHCPVTEKKSHPKKVLMEFCTICPECQAMEKRMKKKELPKAFIWIIVFFVTIMILCFFSILALLALNWMSNQSAATTGQNNQTEQYRRPKNQNDSDYWEGLDESQSDTRETDKTKDTDLDGEKDKTKDTDLLDREEKDKTKDTGLLDGEEKDKTKDTDLLDREEKDKTKDTDLDGERDKTKDTAWDWDGPTLASYTDLNVGDNGADKERLHPAEDEYPDENERRVEDDPHKVAPLQKMLKGKDVSPAGMTEAEVTAKAMTEAEVTAKAKTEAEVTAKAKTEAEVTAKAKTEAEVTAKAKTEAEVTAKAKTEAEVTAKAKTEAEVTVKAKTEAEVTGHLEREAPLKDYEVPEDEDVLQLSGPGAGVIF